MIFLSDKYKRKREETSSSHESNNINRKNDPLYSLLFGKVMQINVVADKTCPGECLYCPYGSTTRKTIERESFCSAEQIVREVENRLCQKGPVKCIVLGGPGEPALHAEIGQIISGIHKITSTPVAVSSCGSLLWRPSVKKDLLRANAVFTAIDAADKKTFQTVNRFQAQVPYARFISGINDFWRSFSSDFYVRVTLIDGVNAEESHVIKLGFLLKQTAPTAIFVGTLGITVNGIETPPIDSVRLQYLTSHFGPSAHVINVPEFSLNSETEQPSQYCEACHG
jgi:wyosine [tRNA(Phe)-imidazoG37] synthetase (radical SAM superfamily)